MWVASHQARESNYIEWACEAYANDEVGGCHAEGWHHSGHGEKERVLGGDAGFIQGTVSLVHAASG